MSQKGKKKERIIDDANTIRCPMCGKRQSFGNFYKSKSPLYASNHERMVFCKVCVWKTYDTYYNIIKDIRNSVYITCMKFDIPFSEGDYEGMTKQVVKDTSSHPMKIYMQKVNSLGAFNSGLEGFDPTFILNEHDKTDQIIKSLESGVVSLNPNISEDLILFWGGGFAEEEYIFLELELGNWQKTHKCDNQAEITLLKEICIKILTIRNKRTNNESVSSDLKELQELMKTASVDPAKANVASAGRLQDTFGLWVKDIEQFRPAEWHNQQEKYKDMDGFVPYIQNYIIRPIKNFITGNRDFIISDNINISLDELKDEDGDF